MPEKSTPTPPRFIKSASTPTIYVEGLSQILVGVPNSRVILHSMVMPANGDQPETRQIACELIMPTTALIDMAVVLLNQIANTRPMIEGPTRAWQDRLLNQLKAIPSLSIAGTPEPIEAGKI